MKQRIKEFCGRIDGFILFFSCLILYFAATIFAVLEGLLKPCITIGMLMTEPSKNQNPMRPAGFLEKVICRFAALASVRKPGT